MIVDLALSVTGSQLIASVLPTVSNNLFVMTLHSKKPSGRQGSKGSSVRVHQGSHRHPARLQNWF